MRTFSAEAQAAMDSGIFEAYIRVGVVDTDPNNFQEWIEPIQYKLTDTELEVVFPIEGTGTYASDSPYIALRRGIYINGIPETTTTTSFFVTNIIKDERFFYYKASILPDHYKNLGTDLTYSEVIESIYLDELNPTVKIIEPTYEVPAHAVWGYLFYPSGRNIIFNSLRSLSTILRQKFLIFLRHTENTYSSKTDIFFYQPTETRTVDYEITDLLYKLPTGGRQINKRLLWRDDSASVTIYDPGSGSGEKYPIHNLGYIPTTGARPTYKSSPPIGGKSSKLSPNLKYETGDYVTINNHTGSFSYRIKVTEIFDANAPMAWYVIVEPIAWFDNTEGGALPSTIEASAPFTPLNTSTFNNNLDDSVNNLQALAEAVDNLSIASGPATTAANDFQVGDGSGNWIKKTLAQIITILGIFADAASDSIYYVRRNATWTNLKTYTDTLYAALTHSHAASDVTSGTIATARLGSGTADSTTFLRGDQSYQRIISAAQYLFGHGQNATIPASTTYYLHLGNIEGLQTTTANIVIPEAATVSKLYLTTNSTQPASGSLVVTLLKNNAATALTFTIAANAVAGTYSNTSNSVSLAAGDAIQIEIKNNATGVSALVTRAAVKLSY